MAIIVPRSLFFRVYGITCSRATAQAIYRYCDARIILCYIVWVRVQGKIGHGSSAGGSNLPFWCIRSGVRIPAKLSSCVLFLLGVHFFLFHSFFFGTAV